jgi:hypothetical protein
VNTVNWLSDTTRGYAYERYADPSDDLLALWDFSGSTVSVTIHTGAASVDVYDWMGNKRTLATSSGDLTLPLTGRPTYIAGVSSALWGSGRSSTNVAVGKTATTSGDADPSSGGALAVDGDVWSNESRWISTIDDNPKWIAIDLGATSTIGEIRFFTGQYDPTTMTNTYNSTIGAYRLQAWNGADWSDIVVRPSNTKAAVDEVFAPVATSKVRLYVEGTTRQVKLYEIEVLTATPASTASDGGTLEAGGTSPDGAEPSSDAVGTDALISSHPDATSMDHDTSTASAHTSCHCDDAGRSERRGAWRAMMILLVALRSRRRATIKAEHAGTGDARRP